MRQQMSGFIIMSGNDVIMPLPKEHSSKDAFDRFVDNSLTHAS